MVLRQVQSILIFHEMITKNILETTGFVNRLKGFRCFSEGPTYTELPRKPKKSERKTLVTSFNELKRRARQERKDRETAREKILFPPDNGLLVKELIPVAHEVYAARSELFTCLSSVVKSSCIYRCSVCGEVDVGDPPHKIRTCNMKKEHSWQLGNTEHIMPLVESFHLYDRVGRAVTHNERLEVDRIPAINELCIQAGVNIPEYPTRRRIVPAYSIAGKIVDFEKRFPKDDPPGKDINMFGLWQKRQKWKKDINFQSDELTQEIGCRGMEAWDRMRSGALKLMKKYPVQTCGYCPEVQVGPKGHRLRNCQAFKHQMRDGQHAWQEATVDDLIPPVYVWHVQDPKSGRPLVNDLKKYYGMLPAVVELFAQAGAHISEDYSGLMRGDVAVPRLDEERFVV